MHNCANNYQRIKNSTIHSSTRRTSPRLQHGSPTDRQQRGTDIVGRRRRLHADVTHLRRGLYRHLAHRDERRDAASAPRTGVRQQPPNFTRRGPLLTREEARCCHSAAAATHTADARPRSHPQCPRTQGSGASTATRRPTAANTPRTTAGHSPHPAARRAAAKCAPPTRATRSTLTAL